MLFRSVLTTNHNKTIVSALKELLWYLGNNPQSNTMPLLLAKQAHPRTETVFDWLGNFVPHFLVSYFLAERTTPEVMQN